ncbi:hypothetical protein SDC9_120026 [bioreactor metagenome]|uniref:Uncharacterized protein n=1 Tax=bioreactor metagenome TaxID=1076179 RepID=A0A645C5K7_9ZZZZ
MYCLCISVTTIRLKIYNLFYGCLVRLDEFIQRYPERVHRTFQAFEQIDPHQGLQALLPVGLLETGLLTDIRIIQFTVKLHFAFKYIFGRRIDGQAQPREFPIQFRYLDEIFKVSNIRMMGDGFQSVGKSANLVHIIVLLDMLPASGDGHTIEQLEEIKVAVEVCEKLLAGALFDRQLRPIVENLLSI